MCLERHVRCLFYCVTISLASVYGCSSRLSDEEVIRERVERAGGFVPASGEVELYIQNNTINDIYIMLNSWKSFGLCCPPLGSVRAGTGGPFECQWLEVTPSETTVVWVDRSTGQEYSQRIDLKRLAQHRFKNKVHFELGANNTWAVRYDDE